MYAYEKILSMDGSQPTTLLREILRRTYPGVGNRQYDAYKKFGGWLDKIWENTLKKRRPKLWLWAGQEATRVFQKEMKSKKAVDTKALHFTHQMVQTANIIGGAKGFPECKI